MTIGPDKVLRIPMSSALVKVRTVYSGNTFGARYWTDGKREAPMLPDSPWLRCCPSTRELFWTDEAEKVGEEEFGIAEGEYSEVPYAEEPLLAEYRAATLNPEIASTPDKQRYIRTRVWWAENDPVRKGIASAPDSEESRENLLKLKSLLDAEDPNQRIMAAEIARELGDFSTAAQLLQYPYTDTLDQAANFLTKLVLEGDSTVRVLEFT